jgi:peroxiredoxin
MARHAECATWHENPWAPHRHFRGISWTLGKFREIDVTIAIGERLPEGKFRVMGSDGPTEMTTQQIFAGKKVVLFGVPGAFTPTCSRNHLPGFLEYAHTLRGRGVNTIAVVAVNDVHVMNAWAQASHNNDRILFLSDGSGDYARAVGLNIDIPGMGLRYRRFSMIVEDGVVRQLNLEQAPGKADLSGAAAILTQLGA